MGGWKVLEQRETVKRHGRLDRKREGRAKSSKMKLRSPLLFPFRNAPSLKGLETNTKKSFLTSDLRLGVWPDQRISPHENTLKEKTNYCERARD